MILLTGASSGLGKFLSNKFENIQTLTRDNKVGDIINSGIEFDTIIHCAASISHASWDEVTYDYFDDNLMLTRNILEIPHEKFIHISSIDIKRNSIYGTVKRISERIVASYTKNCLIIRPSGLIGNEMKTNTFKKIQLGQKIALTKNSLMNYVTYEDVYNLIKLDLDGIVTLTASEHISMQEVSEIFKQNIEYGEIHYEIDISEDDKKLRRGYNLEVTSAEKIRNYLESYEEKT